MNIERHCRAQLAFLENSIFMRTEELAVQRQQMESLCDEMLYTEQRYQAQFASFEKLISTQNEELVAQRLQIESLRSDKLNIERSYQAQQAEFTSLEDFGSMQNEELAALRQQIESLRKDEQNKTVEESQGDLESWAAFRADMWSLHGAMRDPRYDEQSRIRLLARLGQAYPQLRMPPIPSLYLRAMAQLS